MDKPDQAKEDIWTSGWTMFTTSREEIHEMLADRGEVIIEPDSITIHNYPFQPSIVFRQARIASEDIINVDIKAYPPTIRVGDELIFISIKHKDKLLLFSNVNQLPLVERADIWDWILEPFLDTEYADETHQRLNALLSNYGLTEDKVASIRHEVKTQMLKYNFDTMLWEWVHLGAIDVLFAMRTKYDTMQFADFYKRVMDIALLAGQ